MDQGTEVGHSSTPPLPPWLVAHAKIRASNVRRLSNVRSHQDYAAEEGEAPAANCSGGGGPRRAPANRKLHETDTDHAGLYAPIGLQFTLDAQTLVHSSRTPSGSGELLLWDLQTGTRAVGLTQTRAFRPRLSPDGSLLCVAGEAGLAMYRYTSCGNENPTKLPPLCSLLWDTATDDCDDVASDIAFYDVAFSRDSKMVASVQATGQVQIRDAELKMVLCTIDDFHAGPQRIEAASALSWSDESLAVGGCMGEASANQVRLYSINSCSDGFTALHVATLRCKGTPAFGLDFNAPGTLLAVAPFATEDRESSLVLYSSEGPNGWADPPTLLEAPLGPQSDYKIVQSPTFSRNGRFLGACFYPAAIFGLWDLEAKVWVRALPAGVCFVAFSPADDLVAIGSKIASESFTVHELLPATPPSAAFRILGEGADQEPVLLTVASTNPTVAMLGSRKRLVVVRRIDRKVLWDMNLEYEIPIRQLVGGTIPAPVLQPSLGGQVAVCACKNVVRLLDAHTHTEVAQLTVQGTVHALSFSGTCDSSRLVICGSHGSRNYVKVYEASTGLEVNTGLPAEEANTAGQGCWSAAHGIYDAAVDPSHRFLVVCAVGTAVVVDIRSGETVCTLVSDCINTQHPSFDDAGQRLMCTIISSRDKTNTCETVIWDVKNDWQELRRIQPAGLRSDFSPGPGKYVLSVMENEDCDLFFFFDPETGKEVPWTGLLRPLMLPAGKVRCIQWVRPPRDDADANVPLILQAVVEDTLHLVDFGAFIRATERSGNFSVAQLNRLSDWCSYSKTDGGPIDAKRASYIQTFVQRWKAAVNYRDDVTGNTVLHHCACTGQNDILECWLSGPIPYRLSLNKDSHSALRAALTAKHHTAALSLVTKLDGSLPLSQATPLTKDLVTAAEYMPGQVVSLIETLENADKTSFNAFRTLKVGTLLMQRLEGIEVRGSVDGLDYSSGWSGYLPATWTTEDSVRCEYVLEVLALPEFAQATRGELSPFAKLYQAASQSGTKSLKALLNTRVMIVTAQFKWHAFVRRRMYISMYFHLAHYLLVIATYVYTTRIIVRHGQIARLIPNVLHLALMTTNALCLCEEMRQMQLAKRHSTWIQDYLSDPWNVLDLGGIAAVLVASTAHFRGKCFVLQQLGALAVLLNSFTFLKVLRPFEKTGVLIRVVTATIYELRYFFLIIMVLIIGFSAAFAVSMPDNLAFDNGLPYDSVGVITAGVLTSYVALLGSFDLSDFTNTESTLFFAIFLLGIVVIMLNLLIALMSDTFERVMESMLFESRKMRAETIIEAEQLMGSVDLKTGCFPPYLQVLRSREKVEDQWAGVSGHLASTVQNEVTRVEAKVDALAAEMQSRATTVDGKLEMLVSNQATFHKVLLERLGEIATLNQNPASRQ